MKRFCVFVVLLMILIPLESLAENVSSEPRADKRIFIYDQGWSGAHNQGCNTSIYHGKRGWGTLSNYGCGFYVYLHAYQWLTGNAVNTSTAESLISQIKSGINNLAGTDQWDCRADSYYEKYFKQFGIVRSDPQMTIFSLNGHFSKGGVLKTYTPDGGSHYNLAVGIANGDVDGDGVSEYWVHIIDSSAYSTMKAVESIGDTNSCYSFNNHQKLSYSSLYGAITNNRSEDNGVALEYWMKYDTFSKSGICAGFIRDSDSSYDTLQFIDVAYPKTFRIDNTYGWHLQGGTVASNVELTSLKSEILNADGGLFSLYGPVGISGKSYSVSGINTGVKFSQITQEGNYTWRLTATDSSGKTLSMDMPFYATNSGSTSVETMSMKYKADSIKPVISNVQLTNVTSEGYTVVCAVSDNDWVTRVLFPTWTEPNGKDDLLWLDGSSSGSTVSFDVKVSDHGNQRGCKYYTHIYAYDPAENYSICELSVWVPDSELVPTGISLDKDVLALNAVGETGKLIATVMPADAANKTVAWASNNTSIATVDVNGVVTAKGAGGAVITATTFNGLTATCQVHVGTTAPTSAPEDTLPPAPDVTPTPEPTPAPTVEVIQISGNETRTVEARRDYRIEVPGKAIMSCVSGKPAVASADDSGLVRALKAGKAKITVVTAGDKKKFKLTLNVIDPHAPAGIGFAEGKSLTVSMGTPVKLTPVLTPADAVTTLTWSVSGKGATVDGNGVVTPQKVGKAKVTVKTENGKKATIALIVVDPHAPAGVSISGGAGLTVGVGQSIRLTAEVSPATARQNVTWKSGKPKVALVDENGMVTGVSPGKAKITATATGTKKKATATVTVIEGAVSNGLEITWAGEAPENAE